MAVSRWIRWRRWRDTDDSVRARRAHHRHFTPPPPRSTVSYSVERASDFHEIFSNEKRLSNVETTIDGHDRRKRRSASSSLITIILNAHTHTNTHARTHTHNHYTPARTDTTLHYTRPLPTVRARTVKNFQLRHGWETSKRKTNATTRGFFKIFSFSFFAAGDNGFVVRFGDARCHGCCFWISVRPPTRAREDGGT